MPLDKYEAAAYELARKTGLADSQKKNRVPFPKDEGMFRVFGIDE